MPMREAINVVDVYKRYGKREVLESITMAVTAGEVFGLLGPSGSGKTTLVKLIAGIEEPSRGEVTVVGIRMPNLRAMEKVGYMAQSDALYGELTGGENLSFFASLCGLKGAAKKARMAEVAALVNLTDAMKRPVSEFSGGMKRRLSLAIALLHQPPILILDEPTVGIDPLLRKSIWDELWRMSALGTTIVVTTHVMDEAEKCSRLGMIRDGRLIAVGTPNELRDGVNATTIEEAFLSYGGGAR